MDLFHVVFCDTYQPTDTNRNSGCFLLMIVAKGVPDFPHGGHLSVIVAEVNSMMLTWPCLGWSESIRNVTVCFISISSARGVRW